MFSAVDNVLDNALEGEERNHIMEDLSVGDSLFGAILKVPRNSKGTNQNHMEIIETQHEVPVECNLKILIASGLTK